MTEPNPYNAKKDWQPDEVTDRGPLSADDSLFYPSNPVINDGDEELDESVDESPSDGDGKETSHPEDESIEESRARKYRKPNYKKRYDDLKRHYDRKLAEHKAEVARLAAEARANRPTYTPPKTPEDLATFKEQNPDVYDIVETVAHMRSEEQLNEMRDELKRLKEDAQKNAFDKAKTELLRMHPDFEEHVNTDQFHDWASKQPNEIQGWVYRNGTNAVLAARAMDLYKKDMGLSAKQKDESPKPSKPKTPKANAADAVTVSGRSEVDAGKEKVWTQSEIASLSLREYEKYRDEIDEAFAKGRVIKG